MNIKDILKKIAEGTELTAEEKSFLAKYDPEKDESRIPKTRLDQEIAKVKAEKDRADELDAKVSELISKVEELESKGMSEVEKANATSAKELKSLTAKLEALTKERDEAKTSLAKSQREGRISDIAAKHNFSDPSYLDFLAASKKVDPDDETAVASLMKELGTSRPELFKSAAKPGGGTLSGDGSGERAGFEARIKELLDKPELSSREAAEVIGLQSKITEQENQNPQ